VAQLPQAGHPILGVPSANDLAIFDFVDVDGLNLVINMVSDFMTVLRGE
jgi:hypothetical protein